MQVTEETLMQWMNGFRVGRVLLTAVELDLFTLVQAGATAQQVARALGAPERPIDRFLNAVTALGLLEKQDGVFRPTPPAQRFLLPGSPDYMANLGHMTHLWHAWSRLTEVVKSGTPARSVADLSPQETADFIAAMQHHASRASGQVADLLDLSGVSRILDVGGGSGAFAIALVDKAGPRCTGTVLDLCSVTVLTRGYLAGAGMTGRIDTVDGDYHVDPFPCGYDLVFMSSIIHINSPEQNQALVAKGSAALNSGGRLVVREFVMNEDRSGPLPAALFALNMLVNTPKGDTYTASEMRSWMERAGLHEVQVVEAGPGAALVIGQRP